MRFLQNMVLFIKLKPQLIDRQTAFPRLFGVTTDRCCGEAGKASTARVLIFYNGILSFLFRRDTHIRWSTGELEGLRVQLEAFKSFFVPIFEMYQSFEMFTMEWHVMNHLVEDLRQYGGMKYFMVELFDFSHKPFK